MAPSVLYVERPDVPENMTLEEYRRSRCRPPAARRRGWRRLWRRERKRS